jgi:hypothetical protein
MVSCDEMTMHTSECPVIFRLNCLRHVKSDYRCSMSKYRHITYSETNLMLLSPWKPHNNATQYLSLCEWNGRITGFSAHNVLNTQERLYMNIKRDAVIRQASVYKNTYQFYWNVILKRIVCNDYSEAVSSQVRESREECTGVPRFFMTLTYKVSRFQ